MDEYAQLTLRNAGYVDPSNQQRIRQTRLLIAGCGVGSSVAEAAVRLGFEHLILADGDTVAPHNLNRQAFVYEDIGRPKVSALGKRLRAINPNAEVKEFNGWISPDSVSALVRDADLIFDTIDLISLDGIIALHDECRRQRKALISAFALGWGAGLLYFPPHGEYSFRDVFGLPEGGSVEGWSYVQQFGMVLSRHAEKLQPEVFAALKKALTIMKDGKPCPAPQVSAGSAAVASLAMSTAVRLLRGDAITAAPQMIVVDPAAACVEVGVDLRLEAVAA